jgi:choline-sulfatase
VAEGGWSEIPHVQRSLRSGEAERTGGEPAGAGRGEEAGTSALIPMKRRHLLQLLVLASAGLLAGSEAAPAEKKPNILFLFSDDQSFETIRALGHTDIETPNLDRLVQRGTTFTHAYNMGSWSGAVCVASRTMLITGRSVWRAKGIYAATEKERAAGRLWPQLMEGAGYATFLTGKWHIQANAQKSFQVARHIRAGMPKDTPDAYNRPLEGVTDTWSPSDPKLGGHWTGGKHWSEVVGDDVVDFLDAAKKQEKPFFMYAAFNAPHDPRQSPAEFVGKYPLERIAVPRNFLPLYPHKEAIGCGPDLRDEKLAPFPRTEHAVKVHRQEYYALISYMDAQVGRILDALEASGLADNTWIFFTADHGLAVGHHGLFGKQNMYDHSIRVPFVVAGPGVKAGAKIDAPVYLQDVMATALELAGAAKPAQVEFHSVLPLLRGGPQAGGRDAIYSSYLQLQRAVIHDGWKLILYPKARTARLYHVAADPEEMNDLAAEPAHAERRRALFQRLLALQKELADPLDLTSTFADL